MCERRTDLLLLSKAAVNVKDVAYACYFLRQIARIVSPVWGHCLGRVHRADRVTNVASQLLRTPYKKFSQTNAVFEYIGSQCLDMVSDWCPSASCARTTT